MKKIRNYWEDVCRVECMVCDDDDEYIDFLRHKKYDENDKEDYVYYLKFVDKNDWDLSMRIKEAWNMFNNIEGYKFKREQVHSGIMFTFDQCWELNSALLENAKEYGILDSNDIDEIDNFDNYVSTKYPVVYTNGKIDNDVNDEIIMYGKDNLILSMTTAIINGELLIEDFSLGWRTDSRTTKWEAFCRGWNYVFNKNRKNLIQEYEGFMYKSDLIKFLSVTGFIFNHTEQTKNKNILKLPE